MRGTGGEVRERWSMVHLHVRVKVPEVQPTFPIHTGKDGWVGGAPLHIIHILTVVLKRAKRYTCFTLQRYQKNTHTGR